MTTENYELKYTHEEAKEVVIKNANLFYNGYQTEINDLVYDALLDMIKKDEPSFDIYEHIVYDTDSVRAPHSIEFRDFTKDSDIDSINTEELFNEWRKSYIILPKFDGSSTVTYLNKDGSLNRILSRGDDDTGFVNTNKLRNKYFEAMKNRANFELDNSSIRVVLAEAVVSKENGGRAQANGCINSKDKQDTVDNLLFMMPFDAIRDDGVRVPNLYFEITDYAKFSHLRDNGEINTEFGIIPCDGIVMYNRDHSDTKLVIKKLYYSEKKETTITEIVYDASPTSGIFHPVANFEMVRLEDTDVENASLYNYQTVVDYGYGKGAKVIVAKANMTVPKIIEIVKPVKAEIPECPYCSTKDHKNFLVPFGADLICGNPACRSWMYMLQERIIKRYIPNPTEYLTYLSANYATVNAGMVKDFEDNWYNDIMSPMGFLYIACLPRVGEGKIAKISEVLSGNIYDDFTSLSEAMKPYLSELQCSYLEIIMPKIEFIVNKLREY